MGAIDNVTGFIATTSWSDLPPAIRTKRVSCLLDSLDATLVGARTKVAAIADAYAREHLKGEAATILGSRVGLRDGPGSPRRRRRERLRSRATDAGRAAAIRREAVVTDGERLRAVPGHTRRAATHENLEVAR